VLPLIFEAVSALGTVGLSMDTTPGLNDFSKFVVILRMFLSRVGPLGIFAALSFKAPRDVRAAREDVIVG